MGIMILQKNSYSSILVICVLFFFMILSVNTCLDKSIIQSNISTELTTKDQETMMLEWGEPQRA